MSETLLVDTGAWIAFYDRREKFHKAIAAFSDLIESAHLIVPWPVGYETLRTRFVPPGLGGGGSTGG